jgi:hypothetical protein
MDSDVSDALIDAQFSYLQSNAPKTDDFTMTRLRNRQLSARIHQAMEKLSELTVPSLRDQFLL